MADEPDNSGSPPAPSTSLSPAFASEKATIEGMIGDRSSPYYTGTADQSAAWVQQRYQDLIRGELDGADGPVGPRDTGPDSDYPHNNAYDYSTIPGAISIDSVDRDLIDRFAGAAMAAGLGQRKFSLAVGLVLTEPDLTEKSFRLRAEAAGFTDANIAACLQWARSVQGGAQRDAGGRYSPAPAAAPPNAARKAEIESLMYLPDGRPGHYWQNPGLQLEYRNLIAAEIGG